MFLASNMGTTNTLKCIAAIIALSFVINMIGHSLPPDFNQPIKYRFICAGAEFLNYIGHVFEFFCLGLTRLDITRLSYHYTVGVFNIREEQDRIQVIDEEVDHLSMRIFRPMMHESDQMSTIIYYHGGGHFVGSAGQFLI